MRFNLRSRILLFLFLFAFAPLLLAVMINLPLVLERVETFYRHAFLQDLRADFRDLDQHLASRDEMLRLLARLADPAALLPPDEGRDVLAVDRARGGYVDLINRTLRDQLDIVRLQFIDRHGVQRFWLERGIEDGRWRVTPTPPLLPAPALVEQVLTLRQPIVVPTSIRIDSAATHPSREMVVQLLTPMIADGIGINPGAVVMTVDVGGLARRERETLWVHANGRYLRLSGLERVGNAFEDFPGLEQQFDSGRIALWESKGRQVIWVPLFRTSDGQPLWVGRDVDLEPLTAFQGALIVRVLSIIVALVLIIWLAARWIARHAERLGQRVHEDVRRMLEEDAEVHFEWRGSEELRQLGASLTQLAHSHARDRRNLRAHARELEESSRYKSEFLANVSHELRTPLNSILLLSKLLSEELADADADAASRQKAEVIREASRDLRELIDDVLDVSRIESGRLNVVFEPIDVPDLIEDLIDLMSPQFVERGLDLNFEQMPDAPLELKTDPARLRQIIKNFLSNAVKFTRHGGVRIVLRRAPPPFAAQIDVIDTGVGIPAEHQQAIFEAFRQVDGSTGRHYGGTGLGLTISRELARLLNGEIRLESEPGRGSVFSVLLPHEPRQAQEDYAVDTAEAEELAPVSAAPPQAVQAAPPRELVGLRVLLIGGSVRGQLTVGASLTGWGLEFELADDIDEAREALAEQRFDFVLLVDGHRHPEGCASIAGMVKPQSDPAPACLCLADDDGAVASPQESAAAGEDAAPFETVTIQRLQSEMLRLRPRRESPR